jgi:modulator of FtsH protease
MAEVPDAWHDFFVAMAGASAALAGLVMVALSVNIKAILSFPWLPARAGAAVGSLVLAVVVCGLALVPGQRAVLLGAEVLVGAVLASLVHAVYLYRSMGLPEVTAVARTLRVSLAVLQLLPLLVGAVVLLAGSAGGLAWVAAGILLTLVGSMFDAWVLMVEILR